MYCIAQFTLYSVQSLWIESVHTHVYVDAHFVYFHSILHLFLLFLFHMYIQNTMHILHVEWCTSTLYMNIKTYWSHNTGDTEKHYRCTIHIDMIVSNYSWWGRWEKELVKWSWYVAEQSTAMKRCTVLYIAIEDWRGL